MAVTEAMEVGLRLSDWRAGVQLLQDISAYSGNWHDFARVTVATLPRLVPSDLTTLSVCDLHDCKRQVIGSPDSKIGPREREAFDHHFHTHPLVHFHGFAGGKSVHRISDSIAFPRFRHTALYSDYYRPIGIDHAIALPMLVDGRQLVSFVLNRSRRDFSESERTLLEAVREPLARLYQMSRAVERARGELAGLAALTEGSGSGWMRLDPARELLAASPNATRWLPRFCGREVRIGQPLTPALDRWLRDLVPGDVNAPAVLPTLLLCDCGDRLMLQALRLAGADEPAPFHVRMQLRLAAAHLAPLADPSLTPRELQVMQGVAAGKTDREIAALLQCSYRTVQKHLERIYTRLGVETRTAAVMRLLDRRPM